MTLRERLLALADDCELIRGDLVLAAARMALEEVAIACAVTRSGAQLAAGEMTAQEWRTVAAILRWRQDAIRALRDGLD